MMKKCIKGATVFMLTLAVTQSTILNTTVHANETNNVVVASEKATTPYTITTTTADNATSRKFTITNLLSESLNLTYSTDYDATKVTITLAANESRTISVAAPTNMGVTMTAKANNKYFTMASYNAYNMTVNSYVGTDIVGTTTTLNTLENGATYTAPKTLVANGQRYTINGNNFRNVGFGVEELAFQYVLENRAPYKSYVNYVDENGTRLNADKEISFSVSDNGGSFTPANSYTASNGVSYRLMSGQTPVAQAYEEGSKTYTYRFQRVESESEKPYLITIIYKNTDGQVLGTKTQTVTKGASIKFDTANVVVDGNGVEYTRASGEATTITHEFANSKRAYTVVYEVTKAEKPYDITINYVDLLTGRTLSSTTQNVGLNKTVRYNVDNTVSHNGVSYVLSGNQDKTIQHAFGTAQRTYTVYYNEKDKDVTNYNVDVLYFDATNNKVLYATKQEATLGNTFTINAPTSYAADGKEFVLLAGQGEVAHSFYSSRRKYVYFYRDVNDAANKDTIVENRPDGGQDVVNPDNGPIINVDNGGNVTIEGGGPNGEDLIIGDDNDVIIDDNDQPQGDGKDDDVVIEDNDQPQGNGKDDSTFSPVAAIAGGGIALALLGCIIAILIIKKKKAEKSE